MTNHISFESISLDNLTTVTGGAARTSRSSDCHATTSGVWLPNSELVTNKGFATRAKCDAWVGKHTDEMF